MSEQKDPAAKGHWKDDVFHLVTNLDREALGRFFLEEYTPSPIVAPWNGGSGFYEGDNTEAMDAIRRSEASRLVPLRRAITEALRLPELPKRALPLRELLARVDAEPPDMGSKLKSATIVGFLLK